MNVRLAYDVGLLSSLLVTSPLLAKTIDYPAPTGSISSTLLTTMNLTGGGSVTFTPGVGPNCYLGDTCAFSGSDLSYSLPDGSAATLRNFSGTFSPSILEGSSYGVSGQASGSDSLGQLVTVSEVVTMQITGHSGKGGGTAKVYTDGTFILNTVSLPSSIGLFWSGLAGLIGIGASRKMITLKVA